MVCGRCLAAFVVVACFLFLGFVDFFFFFFFCVTSA